MAARYQKLSNGLWPDRRVLGAEPARVLKRKESDPTEAEPLSFRVKVCRVVDLRFGCRPIT
jgi:hypothetical protein